MISNDELIVNIIQIQQKLDDQVLETLPQKEIIPQAIEKIKKDQKKIQRKNNTRNNQRKRIIRSGNKAN